MTARLLYRGPGERSRTGFLLNAVKRAYGSTGFSYVVPHGDSARARTILHRLGVNATDFTAVQVMDGRVSRAVSTMRALRRVGDRDEPMVAVGFTSIAYGRVAAKGALVWCVNGIPEERLLEQGRIRDRIYVDAAWRTARAGRRPDLVVAVSQAMADVITERCGSMRTFVAPNCVDLEIFRAPAQASRRYLTYLGWGAPWQNLDQLARVWGLLARRRPDLRFRVVSKDDRTRVLGREVGDQAIEFRRGNDSATIAALLYEASVGFILRRPGLVNRVAFPTKFGEYVAAGVPVVATDLDWDLTRIIRETGCGVVVSSSDSDERVADEILRLLDRASDPRLSSGCEMAAKSLDRARWELELAEALPR